MSDLAGSTTTARLDADIAAWVLSESPMGPGGAVSVELGATGTLWVDAADPLRIVELVVELDAPGPAVVAALLGDSPAAAIAGAAPGAQSLFGLPVDPGRVQQRRLAGRLALLDDLRVDAPASGWWAAEATLLCAQADDALGLSERAEAEAAVAGRSLPELDVPSRSLTPGVRARALQALTAVAARLDTQDPAAATAVRRLAAELDGGASGPRPRITDDEVDLRFAELFGPGAISADLADATRLALRAVDRGDGEIFEGAFVLGDALLTSGRLRPGIVRVPGTGQVSWHRGWAERTARVHEGIQWRFQPAEMLVRVPIVPGVDAVRVGDVWVRVFNLRTGDLVTIAPLGMHAGFPGAAVARVAVPRDLAVDELAVEVTTRPIERPDGGYTRAVRRACMVARAAASAERLGWWTSATRHWETVAGAWGEIGDTDRRCVAVAYAAKAAERAGEIERSAVLLAEARAATCTWAGALVDREREIGEPFLTEALDLRSWTG